MAEKRISKVDAYKRIREDNHLTGRQKITGHWFDDDIVFDSNSKGGYGETMTFHYTFKDAVDALFGGGGTAKSVIRFENGEFIAEGVCE